MVLTSFWPSCDRHILSLSHLSLINQTAQTLWRLINNTVDTHSWTALATPYSLKGSEIHGQWPTGPPDLPRRTDQSGMEVMMASARMHGLLMLHTHTWKHRYSRISMMEVHASNIISPSQLAHRPRLASRPLQSALASLTKVVPSYGANAYVNVPCASLSS